jgi:hypothetical protein
MNMLVEGWTGTSGPVVQKRNTAGTTTGARKPEESINIQD